MTKDFLRALEKSVTCIVFYLSAVSIFICFNFLVFPSSASFLVFSKLKKTCFFSFRSNFLTINDFNSFLHFSRYFALKNPSTTLLRINKYEGRNKVQKLLKNINYFYEEDKAFTRVSMKSKIKKENQHKTEKENEIKKETEEKEVSLIPPRGMRDIYPSHFQILKYVFSHWTESSELYGYSQYNLPSLEKFNLYKKNHIDQNFLNQMYSFEDKKNRSVVLRPEITTSLCRMICNRKKKVDFEKIYVDSKQENLSIRENLSFPLKWFTIDKCWRYERNSLGRRREHFQWNADFIGVKSVEAEAEILSLVIFFLISIGLNSEDIRIKLNDRQIMKHILLNSLGVNENIINDVFLLFDKLQKRSMDSIKNDFYKLGISNEKVKEIEDIFNEVRDLKTLAKYVNEEAEYFKNVAHLFDLLKEYGCEKWIEINLSVVRGLSYYTGIVFEGFDAENKYRALFGGGRYEFDLHSSKSEREKIFGVGFGMGDEVLLHILLNKKAARYKLNEKIQNPSDISVCSVNPLLYKVSINISRKLRNAGLKTNLITSDFKRALRESNMQGSKVTVIIGHNEWKSRHVRIKHMRNGFEENVHIDKLEEKVQEIIRM